ncbi:MAG: hypothetical protein JKY49_06190 [Cohaesibacteraceae bacterium]|nr:hypothetical protein [Cohaesibacteraceae bacterium]
MTGAEDKSLRVWNSTTGKLMSILVGHNSGIRTLAISPDSRFVASASYDETVNLSLPGLKKTRR